MNLIFWAFAMILNLAVIGAIFAGLYLIIKTAVKKGILEAYDQIRRNNG